ncbi:hypothetical protein [Micromonospora sp. NPDC000442]|uniref:hypothetical protein n=1 Tax=Micromonospora sp. NPDC000442 TaxID=3364217 RepID=UPI0036824643
MTTRRRISADTPLPECPEKRIGLSLPGPISDRLDDLVALAEEAGERTNRKELVASLILAAPSVSGEISVLLHNYRRAKARAAPVDNINDELTIAIRSHRPGPRPRRRL